MLKKMATAECLMCFWLDKGHKNPTNMLIDYPPSTSSHSFIALDTLAINGIW